MDRSEARCQQRMDEFELPPEMWIEIFQQLFASHLRCVRLVCRRWRDIVDGISMLQVNFRAIFAKLTLGSDHEPVHLPSVKKVWFKEVIITGAGAWWPPFGEGLTELVMSHWSSIDISVLVEMLQHAPNLTCVLLDSLTVTGESCANDKRFNLMKLQKLEIEEAKSVKILQAFRGMCARNLKFLGVNFSCAVNNSSLEIVLFVGRFQDSLEELVITCTDDILIEATKLERLCLKKLTTKGDWLQNTENLIEFLRLQPSLELLDICETMQLTGTNQAQLNAMSPQLPKLKSLLFFIAFNAEDEVENEAVDLAFLSRMANLQSLWIMGADENFNFIGNAMPNLRELEVSNTFFAPGRLRQWLAGMPNLRTLTIQRCRVGCWLGLLEVLGSLKQLQHLTLEAILDCTVVGNRSFDLSHLKHLHLKYMELPQELLVVILTWCSGLRELSLENMDLSARAAPLVPRDNGGSRAAGV